MGRARGLVPCSFRASWTSTAMERQAATSPAQTNMPFGLPSTLFMVRAPPPFQPACSLHPERICSAESASFPGICEEGLVAGIPWGPPVPGPYRLRPRHGSRLARALMWPGLSDEVGGLRRGLPADLLVTNPRLTAVKVMRKAVWLGAARQCWSGQFPAASLTRLKFECLSPKFYVFARFDR